MTKHAPFRAEVAQIRAVSPPMGAMRLFERYGSVEVSAAPGRGMTSEQLWGMAADLGRSGIDSRVFRARIEDSGRMAAEDFPPFDAVDALVVEIDPQGKIVRWNRACTELTGFTAERARGRGIDAFAGPVGSESAPARVPLPDGAPIRFESEWITKTGERRRVAWCCARERDPRTRVETILATGVDITRQSKLEDELQDVLEEEKRLEAALRASEAQFSGILAIAGDAIIAVDDAQRIVTYNEGAEAVFGWKKEEVLAKPIDVLIPAALREIHRAHIHDLASAPPESRKRTLRSIVGLRKSGEEFPAEAQISKLDFGTRSLFTVLLRDVSKRMRIEREQRRHLAEQTFLAELDTVFSSSLDYQETLTRTAELMTVFLTDLAIVDLVDGDEIQRVRVAHAESTDRDLARGLSEIPPVRNKPGLNASILDDNQPRLMSEVTPKQIDELAQNDEHRRLLERLAPRSLMAVPLLARGRLIGVLTLLSTQPDRRYVERDLNFAIEVARRAGLAVDNARLYRTAKEAIAARDDVLGIVAHDLRSPLAGIRMLAKKLATKIRDNPASAAEYADEIARAGERMDKLIQALLDITRVEAGKLTVECSTISVRDLLIEVEKACRPEIDSAGMKLVVDAAEGTPDVHVDLDRILQVFTNLVGNAAKFAPAGSRVSISAAPVAASVEFSVTDEGPGIAPENLAHLFDRFWQGEQRDRRGAGLGLAIVKGIVESHGGRVWADSAIGRGTSFHFTVPGAAGALRGR
jgi:PAS domain S-box-containing protein